MATTEKAQTVTPELVMEILRPDEVALSTDGSRIAAAVKASYREKGKPLETGLWVGDVDGELKRAARGSRPRFAPNSKRLAFASDEGPQGGPGLWGDGEGLRGDF